MKRLLVLLAACGHHAPAVPDADLDPANAAIVQHTELPATTAATLTIQIAPTAAGNTLIVALPMEGPFESNVAEITAGDRHFARDAVTQGYRCPRTLDVWSLRGVDDGVTQIEVTLGVQANVAADVLEVSGLSRYPLVATTNGGTYAPPAPDLPLPAQPGQLVVGTFLTCGTLTGLDPGSAFTPFTPQVNGDAAYLVASTPGSYGAHWIFDSGASDAYTLVYR